MAWELCGPAATLPRDHGGNVGYNLATQAANLNAKCDYLFINSHNWGEQLLLTRLSLKQLLFAPPEPACDVTARSKKTSHTAFQRHQCWELNDMTSGYSMAFKSKSLPDQQESSSFSHSSCIPNMFCTESHLHESFDSFQSVSRTVNNGAANMMGK